MDKMVKQVEAVIPTQWGNYNMLLYAESSNEAIPHFVLVHQEFDLNKTAAVRVHSECLTGDLLGSKRCDCGEQLTESMNIIRERKGILIYLRQEGRGIGLINKLKAYNLQDEGLNTLDANLHLGFKSDERSYKLALHILKDLGIHEIDLITNNPEKIATIDESDITLRKRIPIEVVPNDQNKEYLNVKKNLLGHLLKN